MEERNEVSPNNADEHAISIMRGEEGEPLLSFLNAVIRTMVRALAVLMTLVIIWGVIDVVWILYQRLAEPPILLLSISDILQTFGGFIAVLIAIEIFLNIGLYLRESVIHVRLVLATALMAIARKVIVFDFSALSAGYVWATAAVILALGISYWLAGRKGSL